MRWWIVLVYASERLRKVGAVIALGYARCSTQEQADAGNGLAAQEKAIRAECQRRGWQLLDVARDEGHSGKNLDRPALHAALQQIADGEAGGVSTS